MYYGEHGVVGFDRRRARGEAHTVVAGEGGACSLPEVGGAFAWRCSVILGIGRKMPREASHAVTRAVRAEIPSSVRMTVSGIGIGVKMASEASHAVTRPVRAETPSSAYT